MLRTATPIGSLLEAVDPPGEELTPFVFIEADGTDRTIPAGARSVTVYALSAAPLEETDAVAPTVNGEPLGVGLSFESDWPGDSLPLLYALSGTDATLMVAGLGSSLVFVADLFVRTELSELLRGEDDDSIELE